MSDHDHRRLMRGAVGLGDHATQVRCLVSRLRHATDRDRSGIPCFKCWGRGGEEVAPGIAKTGGVCPACAGTCRAPLIEGVRLAAYVADRVALDVLPEGEVGAPLDVSFDVWAHGFIVWGRETMLRATLIAAQVVLPVWERTCEREGGGSMGAWESGDRWIPHLYTWEAPREAIGLAARYLHSKTDRTATLAIQGAYALCRVLEVWPATAQENTDEHHERYEQWPVPGDVAGRMAWAYAPGMVLNGAKNVHAPGLGHAARWVGEDVVRRALREALVPWAVPPQGD